LNAKFFRNGIVMLVLVVGAVALLYTWLIQTPNQTSVGYSAFLADVQSNRIANVTQEDSSLTVKTVDGKLYAVTVPTILTNVLDDMKQAARDGNITLPASIASVSPRQGRRSRITDPMPANPYNSTGVKAKRPRRPTSIS